MITYSKFTALSSWVSSAPPQRRQHKLVCFLAVVWFRKELDLLQPLTQQRLTNHQCSSAVMDVWRPLAPLFSCCEAVAVGVYAVVLLLRFELQPVPPVMPSRGVKPTDTAVSHTQQHTTSDPSQTTDGETPRANISYCYIYSTYLWSINASEGSHGLMVRETVS